MLRILVVTTQSWSTRSQKHARIKKLMGIVDSIETKLYTGRKPEIKDGRPTEEWFEKNISRDAKAKGFNHAIFHFSMEEGVRWGIDSGIRGSNYGDSDYFGESWVRSNEHSVVTFKDGTKRDRYEKTIPHEIGHELKRQGYTKREIHDYDFKNEINNLEGFYTNLVLNKVSNKGRIADLTKLLTSLKDIFKEKQGSFFEKDYYITQHFGVKNPLYKLTGIHIGTDYACPIGTPILAPLSGTITEFGYGAETGKYLIFSTTQGYYRLCHLSGDIDNGKYSKGEVLAHSGNTGLSSGPHLHAEKWTIYPDVSKLTKENVFTLLKDITK